MKRITLSLLVTLFALAIPTSAMAADATINVQRDPGPPETVLNNGLESVKRSADITFTSSPNAYTLRILYDANHDGIENEDPANDIAGCDTNVAPGPNPNANPTSANMTGAASPYMIPQDTCVIPKGSPVGTYLVAVTYFTNDDINKDGKGPDREQSARATFYVSAGPNLTITKVEDTNGNGKLDTGEKGVANWKFDITAPDGTVIKDQATDTQGNIHLVNIARGTYSVKETMQDGWAATTSETQTVALAAGDDKALTFLNVHKASICGTVYKDENRDGKHDAKEATGIIGVLLRLAGIITGEQKTNSTGDYCFTDLTPGAYKITLTDCSTALPVITGDVDGVKNGVGVIDVNLSSGQDVTGQDIGCNAKVATVTPVPPVTPPTVVKPPTVTG